jgi:diguanylate cyclase (GGDEF)-like protein
VTTVDASSDHPLLALVVDDDLATRTRARFELSAAGFRVREAGDGVEALGVVAEERPDFVILDVQMPGIDGFETCRRLRAQPDCNDLPILMVTSSEDVSAVEQAFEAGATDFATKPIQWALLRHRARFIARAGEAFGRLRRTLFGLADSERRLSDAQRLAHVGNWQWLVEADQMLWSEETLRILGYEAGLPASWPRLLASVHPEDRAAVEKTVLEAVRAQTGWDLEHRVQTPAGELRFVHHQGAVDIDPLNGERRVLGTVQDTTQRRVDEEKIKRLAYYDSLTGLPNRRLLHERLERMLRHSRDESRQVAVMFVDIDRFKWVNDSLGHAAGDRLLTEVARRLVDSLRLGDGIFRSGRDAGHFLSRVGGDEFVITLMTPEGPEVAGKVARRILSALQRPCVIEGKEIAISASIGVALYPTDAQSADALMRHADVAMYNAKKGGRNRYQFYTQALSATADRALLIQAALQRALRENSFTLHYQPQIATRSGRIAGLEALVRWELPGKGIVSPGEFIAIAEETGLILPLGEWALERACADCYAWQRQGFEGVTVAVNVSPVQLRRPEMASVVARTLERTKLAPRFLELELTESALLQHTKQVADTLDQLKRMGVRLALDDFGTGYASMSYLKRISFDTLKIDKEFIRDLGNDAGDEAIVNAIVAIARTFGLRVVAEGVETAQHERLVRELGCEAMQGYRLGMPSPLAQVMRLGGQVGIALGSRPERR